MRWGITFLTWVVATIYLANGCVDYFRVWANTPRLRELVLPHLFACGERQAIKLGMVTGVLLALYFGSGWAITRFRAGDGESRQQAEDASRAEE